MAAAPPPPPPPLPEKKNPPLSDVTNFTVPTSIVLANLKSPLLPNPNPNSKPYNSAPVAVGSDDDYSESETSIGSSSFDESGLNSSSVHSMPSRVPLTDVGNRSREVSEPVHHREKNPEKTKDKGRQISLPLTIYSKFKGKTADVPAGKTKDTKKLMLMPISCTSMVNTRNKKKENVEPFSCPSYPRTRKRRTVSNEAENTSVSHSFTGPHRKLNKKKRRLLEEDDSIHTLPREYLEQQKAYFKEIDDFELAEEEVSGNESETEDTSRETLTN